MYNVKVQPVTRYAVMCRSCGTVGTRTHEREAEQLKRVHVAKHVKEHQESFNGSNKSK